jgi:hypothetical protein
MSFLQYVESLSDIPEEKSSQNLNSNISKNNDFSNRDMEVSNENLSIHGLVCHFKTQIIQKEDRNTRYNVV